MMTLKIQEKEYSVKFGYNNFCDSDLLERVEDMMRLFNDSGVENDRDISVMGKMRDLFVLVRELLFEGFKKNNPVDSLQDIGDLLDIYMEETPEVEEGQEPEQRGVFELFILLSNELANEGFLGDLMTKISEAVEQVNKSNSKKTKIPQDHKSKKK
jgi:hypothetical protein